MTQLSPRGLAPAFAVIASLLHAACCAALAGDATPPAPVPAPAIAMHGDPALKDAFDHLPYADPTAVKGGRLAIGFLGRRRLSGSICILYVKVCVFLTINALTVSSNGNKGCSNGNN